MEIKLRARLSAYSRMDAIENYNNTVTKEAIDSLFAGEPRDAVVSKEDIDTLFTSDDDLTSNTRKVTKAEIDSLFN